MDLLAPFARKIFVPMYRRRHGVHAAPILKRINESQWHSADEIIARQWRDIQSLLTYVATNNRFYHDRFKELGMEPGDIKSFDDFAKIPVLSKDDIRSNPDRLISDGLVKERLHWRRTGGSTGVPLHLYWDDYANTFKSAVATRHDTWAHMVPGNKRAALWGDTTKKLPFKAWLYSRLAARTIYLDTLNMNDEQMFDFCARIRKYKPRALMGHGHSIFFFADFLRENNITDIHFEGIVSTAETLFPEERKIVEQVFGDIVYDRYGCEELSLIASECDEHDGLHISAEMLYVEIIGGDETTPGSLVITDLSNRGMPFIRYEIGDLATHKHGACACGRGLPRLGKVVGRTTDVLYTPDGKKVSGVSILDTFTIHIPGFKQVQVIQEQLDKLTFKIVKAKDFGHESLPALAAQIPRFFGPDMKHEVEFVDVIPKTQRGKFQFSICKIDETGKLKDEFTRS